MAAVAAVAAAEGAPDEQPWRELAAAVAAEQVAAAVAAQAVLSAAPDAAVAEAAEPGVRVQHVQPAEGVLVALPRVSAAAPCPFWCALFPERRALFQGSKPHRRP